MSNLSTYLDLLKLQRKADRKKRRGMARLAVVGSRDFPHMDWVREEVAQLLPDTILISGGARGVDTVAEETALEVGVQVRIYPADWNKYGRGAGYIRNKQIVDDADEVWAFWDGKSKGTKHTMDLALKADKPLTVFMPSAMAEKKPPMPKWEGPVGRGKAKVKVKR
jgi:hypothetical protein